MYLLVSAWAEPVRLWALAVVSPPAPVSDPSTTSRISVADGGVAPQMQHLRPLRSRALIKAAPVGLPSTPPLGPLPSPAPTAGCTLGAK